MTKKLNELLPAGLSESAVSDINKLVEATIKERVAAEVKSLSAKVMGFLRLKHDEIQESALAQLEDTNETYRKAKLFEHIQGLMAVEVMSEDYDLPIENLVSENKKLEESLDSMSSELSEALKENTKLVNAVSLLEKKLSGLEVISEQKKQPFKSSEKAVVVSEVKQKTESEKLFESILDTGNTMLDNDMLKLAGVIKNG